MKGVELPINTMIIIVLCLIVLLAIVVLFFGTWNPGQGTLSQEAAKNNACQLMIATRCTSNPENVIVRDFDADRDGKSNTVGAGTGACGSPGQGDTLYMLCKCWYGIPVDANFNKNCKAVCMCEES